MKDSPGYQSIILSFCFPFSVAVSDASAEAQPTASPTEHKSSEGVSEPTEQAITTQPQNTTAQIRSTEAIPTQSQSTTAKVPSTEGPDVECGVVIVGGGKIAHHCYRCKV